MEANPKVGLCYTLAERRNESGELVGRFPVGEGHTSLDALLHEQKKAVSAAKNAIFTLISHKFIKKS